MSEPTTKPSSRLRSFFCWETLRYLGPAFLVSVGYMDPGNWATDLEAGARFGYRLLWVLLLSNAMAIFLQCLSAKLGIATGLDLAQQCRKQYGRKVSIGLWITAEIAMMATDLAEFLGAALGIYLLLHIPLLPAVLITTLDVFLILYLQHFGYRVIEVVIFFFVNVIGFAYVVEIYLAHPQWGELAAGVVLPRIGPESIYVAIGMVGATVMPHNLYLHSALVQYRRKPNDVEHNRSEVRYAYTDSAVALNIAWLVNSAILIMAAAVFFGKPDIPVSIESAHKTLGHILGPAAGFCFALALLASGLSSSTTGTLAGQVVMEGFLTLRIRPWARRLITRLIVVIPVIIAIGVGANPLSLLVFSQVLLSFQLPFAIIPLIQFTRRRDIMGRFVNRPLATALAWVVAAVVIALNAYLLYTTVVGLFR